MINFTHICYYSNTLTKKSIFLFHRTTGTITIFHFVVTRCVKAVRGSTREAVIAENTFRTGLTTCLPKRIMTPLANPNSLHAQQEYPSCSDHGMVQLDAHQQVIDTAFDRLLIQSPAWHDRTSLLSRRT